MPSLDRAKSGGSRFCQEYREFGVIFHIANYHGSTEPDRLATHNQYDPTKSPEDEFDR